MNLDRLIARMEALPASLEALLQGLSSDEARFRPPSGAWSILEIVCHLGDEEVEDFRTRVRSTLEDPGRDWRPIDPEGWARDRRYNDRDLPAMLERFARERAASIAWLRGLSDPDWARTKVHPRLGALRAGDLMVSWAAHDALHLRQVAKRLYEQAAGAAPEFIPAYAGAWGA